MNITKNQLIEQIDATTLEQVQAWVSSLVPDCWSVFRWNNLPKFVKHAFCFNGGDEDWLVVVKKSNNNEPWEPNWLVHTDTCLEPDTYDLGDHVVYVGSHA